MKPVTIGELRRETGQVAERVRLGHEKLLLTKASLPVAALVPVTHTGHLDRPSVLMELVTESLEKIPGLLPEYRDDARRALLLADLVEKAAVDLVGNHPEWRREVLAVQKAATRLTPLVFILAAAGGLL